VVAASRASVADFDLSESCYLMLERLLVAEQEVLTTLCATQVGLPAAVLGQCGSRVGDGGGDGGRVVPEHNGRCLFHVLSDNAPDYQWLADMVTEKKSSSDVALVKVIKTAQNTEHRIEHSLNQAHLIVCWSRCSA
jgi:hypothetical protein